MTGLLGSGVVLALSLLLGLAVGAAVVEPAQVVGALFAFDGSPEHLIVRTQRLPRTIIATLVGAALGVAGALIQALTRNPLASPGILGINAGASFLIVGWAFLFGAAPAGLAMACAFVGAAATAAGVVVLGALGRGGTRSENLILAGAAVTALFSSLTTALLIESQGTLAEVRFWLAGSVAGRDLGLLATAGPALGVGLLLALFLARPVTILALGEDVARGLGQRTAAVRGLTLLAIVLLAGAAVSVAGPIGFVGLVIPNAVRLVVGADYRWIIPHSALMGGALLVVADVTARWVVRPGEVPVGVMTALVGAPVFIHLARGLGGGR